MPEWIKLLLLWLLVAGYVLFLIYDIWWLDRAHGRTQVSIPLRRRSIWDMLVLLCVLFAGIYYEGNSGGRNELYALSALVMLVVVQGMRPRFWRLKQDGFIWGGRFVPYRYISTINLSEDGILRLTLLNHGFIDIAVRDMAALEQAAAFLTGFDISNRDITL